MNKFKKVFAEKILQLKDQEQIIDILDVLFTDKEIQELEKRGQILNGLLQDKSQREISKDLKVGIATVTRGATQVKSLKNPNWWTSWLWR